MSCIFIAMMTNEICSGFPIQSICVSWPKVKLWGKASDLVYAMKCRAAKILFMSCHLPLTAGAKLKTAITHSHLPTLGGTASQKSIAAIRENASLDYRLPSDWARSLG
jgi:hypothetical protein